MTPAQYLAKRDPALRRLIRRTKLPRLAPCRNRFRFLVEAIIAQQLSDKAARTIANRFQKLFRGGKFPSPRAVLRAPRGTIRRCGISGSKAAYIRNVARAVEEGALDLCALGALDDGSVAHALTAVKGIGPWTAEMFLIFALGRPDVFSPGDLGLRNALQKIYRLRKPPSAAWITRTTDRWRPHRSTACRHLWAALDAES